MTHLRIVITVITLIVVVLVFLLWIFMGWISMGWISMVCVEKSGWSTDTSHVIARS
jgi:hypothetical protein